MVRLQNAPHATSRSIMQTDRELRYDRDQRDCESSPSPPAVRARKHAANVESGEGVSAAALGDRQRRRDKQVERVELAEAVAPPGPSAPCYAPARMLSRHVHSGATARGASLRHGARIRRLRGRYR